MPLDRFKDIKEIAKFLTVYLADWTYALIERRLLIINDGEVIMNAK